MILVMEGGNGCGKTTQVSRLMAHFESTGRSARSVKARLAPLVAPLFEELRANEPATVLDLMMAAGLYQQLGQARPDEFVLADRWSYSPIARAVVTGARAAWVRGLYDQLPRPDYVFLLTLPAADAVRRILGQRQLTPQESGTARFPGMDITSAFVRFQTELTQAIVDELSRNGVPYHAIDGAPSIDEVHREIVRRLDVTQTAALRDREVASE
jgi:dTMP kinase